MMRTGAVSRREFARIGASAGAVMGFSGISELAMDASPRQGGGAPAGGQTAPAPPDALRSEPLMDLVLETQQSARLGPRGITSVIGGTFEGAKLKGRVLPPGADWTLRVNEQVTALDVRLLLVTDDDQRIYCSYRGLIARPAAGQTGGTYWRVLPIFETDSAKYEWLTRAVFVGVNYPVPQRVAYRIFQIL